MNAEWDFELWILLTNNSISFILSVTDFIIFEAISFGFPSVNSNNLIKISCNEFGFEISSEVMLFYKGRTTYTMDIETGTFKPDKSIQIETRFTF